MNENKTIKQLNATNGGFYYTVTIAIYVIVSFLGQALMSAVAEKTSTVYLAVCSTFSVISFSVVLIYLLGFSKVKFGMIVGKGVGVKYLPIALLLSIGMFLGLGYVNDAIANIFVGWGLNVSSIKIPLDTVGQYIIFTIVLAVLPAIAEELFFRGIILNSLSGAKQVYAVLISALCFALYHGSVAQLVYQFIYGVALGFLFVTAKSIVPCMVAHFVNNFAVISLNFFKVSVNLYHVLTIIIGAVCLAIFSSVIFLILRKRNIDKDTNGGEIKRFFFPYAIFATIICVALAIGGLVG